MGEHFFSLAERGVGGVGGGCTNILLGLQNHLKESVTQLVAFGDISSKLLVTKETIITGKEVGGWGGTKHA